MSKIVNFAHEDHHETEVGQNDGGMKSNLAGTSIKFRCIRCQHAVKAPESRIGQKMYCPVCFYQLTVPSESTVRKVDPSQLYAADEKPIDVRDMDDRRRQVSLCCKICHTNIAVTREQVGQEIECPECGTKIVVPAEIEQKVNAALEDRLDRIMLGLGETSGKDVYGVHDGLGGRAEEDWSKRFPVYCKLCGTMMYASEDQIGQEIECPDCETKTLVPPRPKRSAQEAKETLQFEGGSTFGLSGDDQLPDVQPGKGRLVPVVCKLCETRMYARESEIGGFKTCPDCETQTEIKAVPEELMSTYEEVSGGGYDVDAETAPGDRPVFRTGADYRTVEGSLDKEVWDRKKRNEPNKPLTDIFGVAEPIDRPVVNLLAGEVVEPSPGDEKESEEERRRKRKTVFEEVEEKHPTWVFHERPKLPPHPFWTRLFTPLSDPWLIARLLMVCLFTGVGAQLAVALPGLFFVVSMPIGLMFFVLSAGLLANTCQSIFLATVAGNDKPSQDDWQDIYIGGSIAFAFWLISLVVISALPGFFLSMVLSPDAMVGTASENESMVTIFEDGARTPVFRILSTLFFSAFCVGSGLDPAILLPAIYDFVLIAGSFCLFFPIFFVSCMHVDSFFSILTKETLNSLLTDTMLWLKFYGCSFLVVSIFQILILIMAAMIGIPERIGPSFLLIFTVVAFAFCSLMYFRLLGRLAWVLQEHAREAEELDEDAAEN